MAKSLEEVKYVGEITEYIVFGFIRRVQNVMPKDNPYYTIPQLIIHWCLLYYCFGEHFDAGNCSTNIALNASKTIATKKHTIKGTYSVGMLSKIVSLGIYRWRFKIVKYSKYAMSFGVCPINSEIDLNSMLYHNEKAYVWIANQYTLYYRGWDEGWYGEKLQFKDGDIIDMILDLDERTLKYIVNGNDLGIAFEDIELTEYRACIDMCEEKTSIQIMSGENLL